LTTKTTTFSSIFRRGDRSNSDVDAYLAQIKNDTAARDRIDWHQHAELSQLGGTPPPRKRG
jgi:hypothetical protein